MIRLLLTVMFLIPLLELWDRWVASISEPLEPNGMFSTHRWIVVLQGLCGGLTHPEHFCRIWIFRVPWVRTWRNCLPWNDFGWCIVFVMHGTGHGWKVLHAPVPPELPAL